MENRRGRDARFVQKRQFQLHAFWQPQRRRPIFRIGARNMTEAVSEIDAACKFMKGRSKGLRPAERPVHHRIVGKRFGEDAGDQTGVFARCGANIAVCDAMHVS